jgi:hypothetical protein
MYTQSASDLANIQGLLHFWQITSTYEIFFCSLKNLKKCSSLKFFLLQNYQNALKCIILFLITAGTVEAFVFANKHF